MLEHSKPYRNLTVVDKCVRAPKRALRNKIIRGNVSSFAPRLVLTPHHSEIAQTRRGYWVVKHKEGLIGGVFRTQKDALRFALFKMAGDSACVRVFPADSNLIR